jgi:RluA family pseudouridine synthase
LCNRGKNLIKYPIIIKNTYKVPKLPTTFRFNTYCEQFVLEIPSRKGVKKAILKGELRLNGAVVEGGRWLKENDVITIIDLNLKPPKEYQLEIEVVFEDDYLAIINKPAGVSVSGNKYKTIQNALSYNLKESSEKDKLNWPLPVHRLDSQTSGLLIIAKTKTARIKLGQAFENKEVKKTYHAIVMGKVEGEGEVNLDIESKKAISFYKTIRVARSLKNNFLTLLELKPKTGRTHQLRIHCESIGCPILGDKIYGKEGEVLKHKGLFLSAVGLRLIHPVTNIELLVSIPTPKKFLKRLESEERRFKHYNK